MHSDPISSVLGWGYFTAWSISFYPQTILNYKRKSYEGVSVDFIILNLIGFVCYSVYNAALYWSPTIREEYRRRNGGKDALIELNDVIFALHATVLSFIGYLQTIAYSKGDGRPRTVPFVGFVFICASITAALSLFGVLSWLDFV